MAINIGDLLVTGEVVRDGSLSINPRTLVGDALDESGEYPPDPMAGLPPS
jgi:hypothetical protein